MLNFFDAPEWPIQGNYKRVMEQRGYSGVIEGWTDRGDQKFELVRPLLSVLPEAHKLGTPEILFAKITDEQIAEWTERFGGPEEHSG